MEYATIIGKCLGTCVINNFLIMFTHDSSVEPGIDRIYKVDNPSNNLSNSIKLFEGNLNFIDDDNNKIQTLPFYENESIQKVY